MAKNEDDKQYTNKTGTELQILQTIEKSYFRNHKNTSRRHTDKSLRWFSQYIPKNFNNIRTSQVVRDRELFRDMIKPGNMYFAVYDPIHKDTLPVYDTFPLLLPWDVFRNEKNGHLYCLSINLHYLPPALRYTAMKALLTKRNEKAYRERTRLRISWEILSAMAEHELFKHSVKMYRLDHFRSKFIYIPPQSWEMAIYLPLARWGKGNKSIAWDMGVKAPKRK